MTRDTESVSSGVMKLFTVRYHQTTGNTRVTIDGVKQKKYRLSAMELHNWVSHVRSNGHTVTLSIR